MKTADQTIGPSPRIDDRPMPSDTPGSMAADADRPEGDAAPSPDTRRALDGSQKGAGCSDGAPSPSSDRPVILVVHASVGSGHRSAAKAVAQAIEELREGGALVGTGDGHCLPDDLDVRVLDILDWGNIAFDGDKTASMFVGATRPIYDLTWRYTFTGRILWGGGSFLSRSMWPRFTEYVRETKPLAIVATHIMAANCAVGARMITGQDYPVVCVPTDYETEGWWPHLASDAICVATEAMAETLRARKVPEGHIHITGIPTRKDFRERYDADEVRRTLGLPTRKRLVLVQAGGHLPAPYLRFRESLDETLPFLRRFDDIHVVVLAGSDAAYAEHVRSLCRELVLTNVTVLDYVAEMAQLMTASDLVICKSGGLTVTECLNAQTPMILLGHAYGQEKINASMLTSAGAAIHVTTPRELIDALMHFSENPRRVQSMLMNASVLRKPNAAIDIAKLTCRLIDTPIDQRDVYEKSVLVKMYLGDRPAHLR